MMKWEYLHGPLSVLAGGLEASDALDALGAEGWELVAVTDAERLWFKRPIEEPAESPEGLGGARTCP